MRVVIAQRRLAAPGGSETFVITLAEHISRLGHEVVVHALELGLAATIAEERAISVVNSQEELPEESDATIALDRPMAIDLARRYPSARRLYAMHNADQIWLPPPEPGIVAATLAPNDRLARLARGCAGAGEVVRITQPVDLRRFSPRGWARDHPKRILLLSNYLQTSGKRVDQLKEAWSRLGLEWQQVGYPESTITVAEEMAKADIVVGYGRSILEAMSCGRPAYVHDHAGSDGWVTAESYERLEADGFAGTGVRHTPDLEQLREDFGRYSPVLGRVGQDLVRTYHDARLVAASVVAIIERLGPPVHRHDPAALCALANLAESQLRLDLLAEEYRFEAKRQAAAVRDLQEHVAEEAERQAQIAQKLELAIAEAKRRETEGNDLNEALKIEASRAAEATKEALRVAQAKEEVLRAAHAKGEALRAVEAKFGALLEARTKAEAVAERAKSEIEALRASTSWRMTAPLRAFAKFLRRSRNIVRRMLG